MLKYIKGLMNRNSLFTLGRFKVRVHSFTEKDKSGKLHSHPFAYISIVIAGGYTEELADGSIVYQNTGSVIVRKSRTYHRIINCLEGTKTVIFTFYNPTNEWNFCDSIYVETDQSIIQKLYKYANKGIYIRKLSNKFLYSRFENGVWYKGSSNSDVAYKEQQPSMDQQTPSYKEKVIKNG